MAVSGSGRITFKALLSLAFIAAVIYLGFKTIPAYINDYQLNDYIESQTPYWLVQHASADGIRKNVLRKAEDLGLPVAEDNVSVDANANKVSVSIDYHVPVDLKVYTLQLHFTHSSASTAIQ